MATGSGTETGGRHPIRQPSRWKRDTLLLVLLAVIVALAFGWSALRTQAIAASAFAARTACICRHVSGLPLASCKADVQAGGYGRMASLVTLSEDAQARSVSAGVPLLARQSADFRPERGCQLERWED